MNRDPLITIQCELCGKPKEVRLGEYNRGAGKRHASCHRKARSKYGAYAKQKSS